MDTKQNNQTQMEEMDLPSNQCSPCSENNKRMKATKYCLECQDYYCEDCVNKHSWFPALCNHTLCEAEDRTGTHIPGGLSTITLICDVHKTETIDAYCPQHDDVLCAECLKENHSSCANVVGLTEAANHSPRVMEMRDVVTESLKVGQRLDETVVTLNEELHHLKQSEDEAIIEVQTYSGELDLTLFQLEGKSIDSVLEIHDKLAATLLNERETVENLENELKSARFQNEMPFSSQEQHFVALHQQKKKQAIAKEALNSMTRAGRFEIKFTAEPDIKAFLQQKKSLGEIEAVNNTQMYTLSYVQKLNVKNADVDELECYIMASCVTLDNKYFLLSDVNNGNVKRFEVRSFQFKDYCKISGAGMCCLSLEEVAVIGVRGIYVLSMLGRMRVTRHIDQVGSDLAYCNGKLFVTCHPGTSMVKMYGLNGQLIKTISSDKSGNKIFGLAKNIAADEKEGKIYVADSWKGLVILDTNGDYIVTVTHETLNYPYGVCTDGKGCVFVCGAISRNVLQYNKERGKLYELVKASNDIGSTNSICFAEHDGRKCIIAVSRPFNSSSFSDYVYTCFVDIIY